jgi:hypothetical protein
MRKVIIMIVMVFITHICAAPAIDIHLKMDRFNLVSDNLMKQCRESEFLRFMTDLGRRESGNNWLCINRIGCFGEWQFAESTLQYLGFKKITLKKFRANPGIFPREMQMKAMRTLIRANLTLLTDYECFIGDTIKGILVTRSGMIAAAHLGGAGSLKKYLITKGAIDHHDSFGTAISSYLRKFNCYELD